MNTNLYWKYTILLGGGTPKWTTLYHNGPYFYEEYKQHFIPVIINSQEIILPPQAEEYITILARYLDTDYYKNTTFKKNFWKDFKDFLPDNIIKLIDPKLKPELDQIDISLIYKHLINEKENKKKLTKEEKDSIKEAQNTIEEPYKYCIIDGVQQNVGNYKIEPPSIFIGRGNHPKIGRIKKRIYPEDVIINLSKDAKIPEPNIKDHTWKQVVHDRNVIWLSSWKEEITGKNKYIFTSFDSFFKSKSDEQKFDLAKKLKKRVHKIRAKYEEQLTDIDPKIKQLATALYFIDNLALRVGGIKDTKEAADTVGVTSLRVEHITLLNDNIIQLDFLGKDSIRYYKKISVKPQVYENLTIFIKNKNKKDDLFDLITPNMVNEYLNSFMKNLTSKVWRTYNASIYFQKELNKIKHEDLQNMDNNERLNYLIAMFNQANTIVALLCNHQKSTTTSINTTLDKINKTIKELKNKKKKYIDTKKNDKINKINNKIKLLKLKKDTKVKMKNVSLGTSKNNYIDPRIIFSFIKKFDIPPEKLFTSTLLKRFKWASNIENYEF